MNMLRHCRSACDTVLARLPVEIPLLACRLAVANVFWRSAQTKISGWEFAGQQWQFFNVTDSTLMLFQYEYALPLLPYRLAAYLASLTEFWMALLLVAGLGTRLAAAVLLSMTAVIQFLVYPDAWPTHLQWMAMLLVLVKLGAGRWSLDRLINRAPTAPAARSR